MEYLILILKSAAILAIFYLVYRFLLSQQTHFAFSRHFLTAGLFASCLLPFWIFIRETVKFIEPVTTSSLSPIVSQSSISASSEIIPINWWQVLLTIYLIGLLIMGLRFLFQVWSIQNLLKGHQKEIKNRFIHIKVNNQIMPFSFFNFIVYNPKLHSQEELTYIICHETVHASQLHSIDIMLVNLFLVFHWCNPLAYLYKKAIEENLEFMADKHTAIHLTDKVGYQLALVRASSTYPMPPLINNFKQSFIKKRIIMLNKNLSNRKNVFKTFLVLPILALFLYSFNVKEKIRYVQFPSAEKIDSNNNSSIDAKQNSAENRNRVDSTVTKLYIINGKKVNSNSFPKDKELAVEGITKILNKKEGLKKYGEEGKNGVIEIEGKISFVPKNAIMSNYNINSIEEKNHKIKMQDISIIITKNTTKNDLEVIKKNLKENENIDFNYSKLDYNNANQLTGISITYVDAKGNKGNYNISTSEPINDIYIGSNENGGLVFRNTNSENTDYEYGNDEKTEKMDKMRQMMEEKRAEMEKKREEMEAKRDIMEAKSDIMEKKREEMDARREEMDKNREEMQLKADEMREKMMKNQAEMTEKIEKNMNPSKIKIITKDMTDADLQNLKSDFATNNIDFDYSGIKRNNSGEITAIKIKLDNNKGSKTNSNVNSDKAISPITLGMDGNTSIIRN